MTQPKSDLKHVREYIRNLPNFAFHGAHHHAIESIVSNANKKGIVDGHYFAVNEQDKELHPLIFTETLKSEGKI